MINNTLHECSKLAQKESKTRPEWVGMVILCESCKRLNFDLTFKWYISKPESFQENETHKILYDWEIQTCYRIPTRKSHLVVINRRNKKEKKKKKRKRKEKEKNKENNGPQRENDKKRKDIQILDLTRELEKAMDCRLFNAKSVLYI